LGWRSAFRSRPPAPKAPNAGDPQQQPIRVEVDLVSILASVVDKTNRPIIDLPKDAFQIYDEGKLQSLTLFEAETHQPIDLALMVDSSMSTALDFPVERDAAARFYPEGGAAGRRYFLLHVLR